MNEQTNALLKPHSFNELFFGGVESLQSSVTAEIEKVIGDLKLQLAELEQTNPQEKIFELSEELKVLQHRLVLRENWTAIEGYVKDAQLAVKSQKTIGTTKHITTKHNELFKELVTEKYVRQFEHFLETLHCPLKVKIKTKSQKGETLKQIVLETADAGDAPHKLEKILSEGKRQSANYGNC